MNYPDFGQFFITRAHAQDATGLRYSLKDSSWDSASFDNCHPRWVSVGSKVVARIEYVLLRAFKWYKNHKK